MNTNDGLPLVAPLATPTLDPGFRPAALANRAFRQAVEATGTGTPVAVALEREGGAISRFDTAVFGTENPGADGSYRYLERWLKFLLWSRGGYRLYFAGPEDVGDQLRRYYEESETGRFDAEIMGEKIYDHAFEFRRVAADEVPTACEQANPLGGYLNGCRIGFDLGASDRKAAAVIDGETVFSEETVWDPRAHDDPEWHLAEINDSLEKAAAHLPRVDAIGGSAAGVYVNNRVKIGSLFRGIPTDRFETGIKPIFEILRKKWNNVPFEVVNDGEVTALAGAMSIGSKGVLGIALGSSEAGGYVNMDGNITTWLNELAFAPVDYNPLAAVDEWSRDYGCGVLYFSQQCVGRLLDAADIVLEADMPLPDKLKEVQRLMAADDDRAKKIYQTIGTYLGYTAAHYSEFYEFRHLLVLGRVTTGAGGHVMLNQAREVLRSEFAGLADKISFHMPDEQGKRHGQSIAAASLPEI